MSFAKAKIIKLTTNIIPTLMEYSRATSEIGEPFNFSIAIINNCPPSNIGMGSKFSKPKLILNRAIIDKKVI